MAARKKKEPPAFSWSERREKTRLSLPLVGEGWNRGVDRATPSHRVSQCADCELGAGVTTPCMPALDVENVAQPVSGEHLLVVGTSPTKHDDLEGQINPDGLVGQVLSEVAKHWPGPVRFAYAVSCHTGRDVPPESVEACGQYLANEILEFKPDRILAVGDVAARALFGHRVNTLAFRRSWGEVLGVRAFAVFNPQVGLHNRFASRWWRDDLRWALSAQPEARAEGEVRVLGTVDEVRDYLASLVPGLVTTVDCEWRGQMWRGLGWTGDWEASESERVLTADPTAFHLLCIGFCQDPLRPALVPGQVVGPAQAEIKAWLEDPRYPKAGHNFKEDRHALWRGLGADVAGATMDTLVWARQLNSDSPAGLKSLAWNVGWGGYAGDAKEEAEDEATGKDFSKIDPDVLHTYNARDVVVTRKVMDWLEPQMARYMDTWTTLLRPAQTALLQVERWGALLSEQNVRTYDRWLEERLTRLDQAITQHVPAGLFTGGGTGKKAQLQGFNPGSTKQVQELLFTHLGVKPDPKRKTATGAWSVDRDAMEAYKSQHPLIPLLQEHGVYRKQRAAFGLGLLDFIGYDGRVHPSYRFVRSLRLGCGDPNMQQIPSPGIKPGEPGWDEKRGEDEGVWARGCWVAPPGYKLIQVDFAQMELRIAAMLSGDEVMAAAFEAGHDFHRMTGAAAYNIPPEQVNAEQRRVSKVINFAIIFGMDEHGIAGQTGIPKAKARELLLSLLGRYRKFDEWRKQQIAQSENSGESFVRWTGPGIDWAHRRDNWGIGETGRDKEAEGKRKHGANVALNGPIQTVANFFSLASLVEVVRWITDEDVPAKVVATVHDALLLEVREDLVAEVAARVTGIMTGWPSGVVKLKADAEAGGSWGEMYKIKEKA